MLIPEVRFQTKYRSRNPISICLNRTFEHSICRLVREAQPETLLDAGCGEGVVIRRLRGEFDGMRIEGLDPHGESLSIARRFNPRVRFHRGSIYHLPFKEDAFDAVLCSEVLEHLEDPVQALQELVRVAARHIIVTVPNEPLWRIGNILRFKYWKDLGNTPTHIQHWTPFSFRRFVGEYVPIERMYVPLMWTMLLCEKRGGARCRSLAQIR